MNRDDLIASMSSLSGYPPGSRTVQAFVSVAEDYADSSGQVVQRVLDECAALDEESRRAMKNADRAREREDRTMHAVNVRHSRIAHQAAARIRAAVAGPQRDRDEEGGQ